MGGCCGKEGHEGAKAQRIKSSSEGRSPANDKQKAWASPAQETGSDEDILYKRVEEKRFEVDHVEKT